MAEVQCVRCEKAGPEITSFITFAGELKAAIAERVCQPCWDEWLPMQIKVLNEYRLHMGEPEHRKVIDDVARSFFRLDGGDGEIGAGPEGGLLPDPSAS